MSVEVQGPKRIISFIGENGDILFSVSESVVTGWLVVLIVSAVVILLTRNLQKIPTTKRQCAAEYIVTTVNKMVDDNMGDGFRAYAPYIAAVFAYILIGGLISLLGFRSVTADISVTGTLAVMTFILITYNKINANGAGKYLLSLVNPMNIVSELSTPLSMALRLFGNVAGGSIIMMILYAALGAASGSIYKLIGFEANAYYFNIFQVGVPAILSVYFDLFSGVIQSYVFIMLTMAYIRTGRE